MWIFKFITNIDNHLIELVKQHGPYVYIVLFLVIFCETGLVITPLLPGDSLLFATGALVATKISCLNIHKMLLFVSLAAILGDACNYMIGKFFGKKIFCNPNQFFLNKFLLKKTHDFYKKYSGKTIIFARFIPIIRTFAPFIAGVVQMNYMRFSIYNIIGGILWVTLFLYTGYFFGQLKFIKTYFKFLIIILILISLSPGIIKILQQQKYHQK